MKNPMKKHLYDFRSPFLDGPRVVCGRDAAGVYWTPRESLVTCKRCLKLAGKEKADGHDVRESPAVQDN
jgi:hypothetical protein